MIPNADGSLNSSDNEPLFTPTFASNLVTPRTCGGEAKKALVCVGGASTESGFLGAAASGNVATFVHNLTNFAATYGYDGIDVDWEPLPATDFGLYTNFIISLRAALDKFPQHKLLTAAVGAYPNYGDPPASEAQMLFGIQSKFDQINVMTYDLSGPYDGWVTWFNAPIYDGNYRFPSTGGLVPSSYASVTNFIANGLDPAKLAIGVAFYGYVWGGGAGTTTGGADPTCARRNHGPPRPRSSQISYYSLMYPTYYQSNLLFSWDSAAQAAYLSITNSKSGE